MHEGQYVNLYLLAIRCPNCSGDLITLWADDLLLKTIHRRTIEDWLTRQDRMRSIPSRLAVAGAIGEDEGHVEYMVWEALSEEPR